MLSLPIFSEVHIWREKNGQNKLYKLLAINSKIYIINILYRPTNFQLTVAKPYYIKKETPDILKQEDQVNQFNNKKELNK